MNPDPEAVREAAAAIRRGELVVFPTETVYGLAADALNEAAVQRVFEAKSRRDTHALPVQVAAMEQLSRLAREVPEAAEKLVRRFCPGPITLVLPKSDALPDIVTGGAPTVGVRIPDHAVALALLGELGSPIVATSANISGRSAPRSAGCAIRGFANMVAVVLDAGETTIGVASTVVDVSVTPARILRLGAVSAREIREVLGEVDEPDEQA